MVSSLAELDVDPVVAVKRRLHPYRIATSAEQLPQKAHHAFAITDARQLGDLALRIRTSQTALDVARAHGVNIAESSPRHGEPLS